MAETSVSKKSRTSPTLQDASRDASWQADPVDLNELPVSVIHDRLNQAHATLDLLYTMTTVGGCAEEHIETLCKDTLSNSLHSAMLRIEEAMEAAKRWASHG